MAPNLLPFWVGWRSERGGPKSVFGGNGRMSDVSASNRIALSRPEAAYRREPRKLTAPCPASSLHRGAVSFYVTLSKTTQRVASLFT